MPINNGENYSILISNIYELDPNSFKGFYIIFLIHGTCCHCSDSLWQDVHIYKRQTVNLKNEPNKKHTLFLAREMQI